jgi:predicted RNA-binding Zn-ribbon protein involved in translation (DUF1610 family)
MTEETATTWQCPKDGTVMQARGRRSGAWRCPTCRGMFMDTETMRQRRPPKWAPVVTSVLVSLSATVVVRRLRRRPRKQSSS